MLPMRDGTGNWDSKSLWPWCFTSVAFGSASLRVRLRRDAPGLDPGLQVRRPAIPFLPVGKVFCLSLMGHKTEKDYDCMVPIPLHNKRLKSRGFNQSLLLDHHLLRNLKRHSSLLKPRLLRRVRATTPQTELP